MKSLQSGLVVCLFLAVSLLFSANISFSAEQSAESGAVTIDVPPGQIDSTLAKLSDEQVRSLLIAELTKDAQIAEKATVKDVGLIPTAAGWLHMLDDKHKKTDSNASPRISMGKDIRAMASNIGNGSVGGLFLSFILIAAALGAGFLAELGVKRFTAEFSKQFQEQAIPDLDGPMRFVAGVMRSIPTLIHILVFCAVALVLFQILPGSESGGRRYLFLALLFAIIFYRTINQLSLIIAAPKTPELRVLPMLDKTATVMHRAVVLLCSYTFISVLILALLKVLGCSKPNFLFLANFAASVLIGLIILGILKNRAAVRERILKQSEQNKTKNWVVEQVAKYWHVPTILYFLMSLAILISNQAAGVKQESPAFLLSLTALPLFLLFDAVGQWVVRTSMTSLRIYNPDAMEEADEEMKVTLLAAKERERIITVTAGRCVRLLVLAALLIWAMSLWGYNIPYASSIAGAVFQSLTAMALGLISWRFISSYIERKIAESTPEVEETSEDDEFGGAAQRGRSFTLLPMVRKVMASVLLVMVSLVVLSSFGVDIGPLLAGAGVVGLAIGFGAQKLVSDVFSGFFYLLDDAFRVGEYIQAGSVSGAVESITLRNVMLRHHRGMLQIVPHSNLGSITNFMRGGIIEKFNLDFPYDANVDKIRKVIKKVGKAMLDDEEFAGDFINPVKSAGVRSITGSVMTIRVKFKTQPGAQFVIRREAYRRITDALAAQGIFYAHRKVIVELPEEMKSASLEDKQKILEAGAAAEIIQLEEDKKAADSKGKGRSGM
jgi:moderate conductance mechanosensitive channel